MFSRRSIIFAKIAASTALIVPAFAADTEMFNMKLFTAAQKADKPILVAIHASWCPTCKAQDPSLASFWRSRNLRSSCTSS